MYINSTQLHAIGIILLITYFCGWTWSKAACIQCDVFTFAKYSTINVQTADGG